MGKIFLFCACALLFAQISNAAEDAKAVLQADPASGLWKKADIGIIKVQKGTALWFGIPESECPAGKFGRAVVGKDGNLVFEKRPDVPLRFLGFNCLTHGIFVKGDLEKTRRRIKEKVEMIRAQGYNAVTYWPETFSRKKGAENVLLEYEDATDYLLAELKKNGIYIQFRLARPNMGQPEYAWETRDDAKFRCIMLEPKMLEIWRKFATRHLTRINPYTGTCLAEDPMVISVNFFGEMNSGYERLMSQVPYLAPLAEREWRKWLADKYGTIEKLNDAWKLPKPLQSFGDVSMKHYMKRKRPVADWFLFISWKHTQFNKFCRKVIADANYKGLVFEGDGSLHMTDSLARAQDSDICALDRYYCHPRGGFGTVGCKVFQTSAIGDAAAYWRSTASVKINNRPMIIMEYNHCHWNKYKHESGLLFPAYSALQGYAQLFVHDTAVAYGVGRLGAFSVSSSPVMRANEVLSAFLFLRGDVARSPHRVDLVFPKEYMEKSTESWLAASGEQTKIALMTGFATAFPDYPRPDALKNVSPKPADISVVPEGGEEIIAEGWFNETKMEKALKFDLQEFVEKMKTKNVLPRENRSNPKEGVFESDTSQILMKTKEKFLSVTTPRTVGAAMKAGGRADLGVMRVESTDVDSVVALCSVDGKPLEQSSRMLLIFSTDNANTGEMFTPDGITLLKAGTLPILMRVGKLSIELSLAGGKDFEIYPLHSNGARRAPLKMRKNGNKWSANIDTSLLPDGVTPFFEIAAK